MLLLAIGPASHLAPAIEAPARVFILAVICWICWPREVSLKPAAPLASIAIGALVFVLWIAPDLLFSGYRQSILFSNAIIGHTHSSLSAAEFHDPWILTWRRVRSRPYCSRSGGAFLAWLVRCGG